MSFNVLPFGSRLVVHDKPVAGEPTGDLIDLASRRAASDTIGEIPAGVLNEIDAAAMRWEDLRGENREIRFDEDADSGRVTASLADVDGGVVRRLPLREVVAYDDDGPHSAA